MEFTLLGPVEVRRDGEAVALGGPKQRALLALLLLSANEAVSRDRLLDGLWGDRPPLSAGHTLDDYISRLRKALGPDRIVRQPPGYLIKVQPGELDLERFESLLARGRELLADGDTEQARAALGEALALWQGQALADLLFEPFATEEARLLEERRLLAVEESMEADLALGRGRSVIGTLERLIQANPLRERLVGQLMTALYSAGRHAEALSVFQTWRLRLAEELGLEPGPQLVELERRILSHDRTLPGTDARPLAGRPGGRRRLRLRLVGAATAAVLTAAAVAVVIGRTENGPSTAQHVLTSAVVDVATRSGAATAAISVADAPAAITADGNSLWLAQPDTGEVARIAARARVVVERIPVGGSPGAIAVGGGSIWTVGVPGNKLVRIDPTTEKVTQTIPLGNAEIDALAVGAGGVWLADTSDDALIEIDPRAGTVERTISLSVSPTALIVVDKAVWVADYDSGTVAEVDARSGQTILDLPVGTGPAALAAAAGAVWVANSLDSTVSRIDPARGSITATIAVGSGPGSLAHLGDAIWVANAYGASLTRIDSADDSTRTVPVSGAPTALAATPGHLWVGVRPLEQRRGGTLVLLHSRPITTDPALQLDLGPLQSEGLTRDGLVSYNHASGPAGLQLVPDLAMAIPAPSAGGTVYTFRLRPSLRYSNGAPVRAADFRRGLERVFKLRSPDAGLFADLLGGQACLDHPVDCDLSHGIVTHEASRTVSFRLTQPDAGFLNDLTVGGLTSPVPAGTPLHGGSFPRIPGTGPYEIAKANTREIVYIHNPYFREWSHAAQPAGNPDRIIMRFGLSAAQEARAIADGRADWMAEQVPGSMLATLETRYPAQVHSFPLSETDFLQINTTLEPFNNVRARRALNLALDRRVVVRAYGGSVAASPACQILPPGLPGYRPYCPYTLRPGKHWHAPDLRRARAYVAASGTRNTAVTVWGASDDPTISPSVIRYVASVLDKLGYRAKARLVPTARLGAIVAHARIQLIATSWLDSSPNNFFSPWFTCRSTYVHGWFCDPRIDRQITQAQRLASTNPQAATAAWARIDRELTNLAVWVPLANPRQIDFVSRRVHNFQHSAVWDVIADQLSVESG